MLLRQTNGLWLLDIKSVWSIVYLIVLTLAKFTSSVSSRSTTNIYRPCHGTVQFYVVNYFWDKVRSVYVEANLSRCFIVNLFLYRRCRSNYQRRYGCDSINRFDIASCVSYPNTWNYNAIAVVVFVFNDLRQALINYWLSLLQLSFHKLICGQIDAINWFSLG